MSQITTIRMKKTAMVDGEALEKALKDLGYKVKHGGRAGFLGPRVDLKIVGRAAGFRKEGRGYTLVERLRISGRQGLQLNEVLQRYSYHTAVAKLEAQGFSLAKEDVGVDGKIHLVLRRMT